MNVIYSIITENEISQFTDRDWELLESLLDDTLALQVRNYMESPEGNKGLQDICRAKIGSTVLSYTFHLDVAEQNINQLVREVQPETVLMNPPDYIAEIKQKFTFLKENYSKLRTSIPARKRQDWDEFYDAMCHRPFSTPSFVDSLKVNKQIFCSSRETDRILPTKYIITVRSRWEMALNAILYDERCRATGNTEYSLNGRLRFF